MERREEWQKFSNNSDNLLSNARIYYEQHPGLYEKYIKENRDKICLEEMISIGNEALKQIDTKYLVRSRIALLVADIILDEKDNVTKAVELYWLEAFRSDTRVVHYIRMMMECNDFSEWKEELRNINHNMLNKVKGRHIYYDKPMDLQENMPNIDNIFLIALLNGEYKYVKDHGMNYKDALGWSSSYMKQGLAAFLMILINEEKLSEGGKAMLSKIVSSVAFTTREYRQGVSVEINETDMEYFWKSVCRSKVLHPMTESEQKVYLEWIEMLVRKRVDGIMDGNHRNYYFECAEYIAALGEVLESRGVLNARRRKGGLIMSAYKDTERGSWYVSFHYYDWTGKNRRKLKRGFKTKKEATDFEHHFKMEQSSDLDMTFGDFWEVYTENVKPKIRYNTCIGISN
ncbi:MAG: Arm DNA-binding domain-containing protein [Lachnospiraceae bacterium]|nr:Arm DNA-binding domain-containing protein [Lachnospiraceae bacterium]